MSAFMARIAAIIRDIPEDEAAALSRKGGAIAFNGDKPALLMPGRAMMQALAAAAREGASHLAAAVPSPVGWCISVWLRPRTTSYFVLKYGGSEARPVPDAEAAPDAALASASPYALAAKESN